MKLVCAPVKQWPKELPVDLYEFTEGPRKLLFDCRKKLRFISVDWKEKKTPGGIISYHNFDETPDLEAILSEMKSRHPQAQYYKIATFARSTLDALKMLHFQKKHPEVIGLCMGENGVITRILAPFTYAPLAEEDKNAPGQLLWSELKTIYRYPSITSSTRLYGLIGHPVSHSIGHLYHNDQFSQKGLDAIYVKMAVKPEELQPFFEAIQGLPFYGFSVTAPLKEKIDPSAIVNTLYKTDRWEMCNTDGTAVVDVLGPVSGKQIVILGAGGAAKAIASELAQQGAHVTLLKRGMPIPFYDILINATSSRTPDFHDRFIPGSLVVDISIQPSPFLEKAHASGCITMDGFPMYFAQAALQSVLWTRLLRSEKAFEIV